MRAWILRLLGVSREMQRKAAALDWLTSPDGPIIRHCDGSFGVRYRDEFDLLGNQELETPPHATLVDLIEYGKRQAVLHRAIEASKPRIAPIETPLQSQYAGLDEKGILSIEAQYQELQRAIGK